MHPYGEIVPSLVEKVGGALRNERCIANTSLNKRLSENADEPVGGLGLSAAKEPGLGGLGRRRPTLRVGARPPPATPPPLQTAPRQTSCHGHPS